MTSQFHTIGPLRQPGLRTCLKSLGLKVDTAELNLQLINPIYPVVGKSLIILGLKGDY